MLKTVKNEVLGPLMSRIGTATSMWLVATIGIDADYASQIGIGVTAIGLVMADLLIAHLLRKQARK